MKKSPRDFNVYLDDILESIVWIERYTKRMTAHKFIDAQLEQDAIVRRLIIIGEAANHLPKSITKKLLVPWRDIIGMRNFIVHDYSKIIPEVIWKTIKNDIPSLKEAIINFRQIRIK
jgi:uncharacterized protein with HEPN domain